MGDLYKSAKQYFPYDQFIILQCIKLKNEIAMQYVTKLCVTKWSSQSIKNNSTLQHTLRNAHLLSVDIISKRSFDNYL